MKSKGNSPPTGLGAHPQKGESPPQVGSSLRGGRGRQPPHGFKSFIKKGILIFLSLSVFFGVLVFPASAEVIASGIVDGQPTNYEFYTPFQVYAYLDNNRSLSTVVEGVSALGSLGDGDNSYENYLGGNFGSYQYSFKNEAEGCEVKWFPTTFNNVSLNNAGFDLRFYDFGRYSGVASNRSCQLTLSYNVISHVTIRCQTVSTDMFGNTYTVYDGVLFDEDIASDMVSYAVLDLYDLAGDLPTPFTDDRYAEYCSSYVVECKLTAPKNGDSWGGSTTRPFMVKANGTRSLGTGFPSSNPSTENEFLNAVWFTKLIESLRANVTSVSDFTFGQFISSSVGGFLSTDFFGSISFGDMLLAIIAIGLLIIFLKMFAGG